MNATQQHLHCAAAIAAVNCTLQSSIGRFERCSREACPLWADGECLFEDTRSQLLARPYVAQHLLDLRGSLTDVREAESRSGFRSPFHRMLKEHMFRVHRSLSAAA